MKNSGKGQKDTEGQAVSAVPNYDIALLFPVLFLVGIGIVMVYSASSAIAVEAAKPDYHFLRRQAIFGMIGIIVLVGGQAGARIVNGPHLTMLIILIGGFGKLHIS